MYGNRKAYIAENVSDGYQYIIMLDIMDSSFKEPGCEPVHLTDIEMQILWLLMKAEGRLVTDSELISKVWMGCGTKDALRHRVSGLRRKIGRDKIATVHGRGYRLAM